MPCKLSPQEQNERAKAGAHATQELIKLEQEKKDTAAEIGQRIKEQRAEVAKLSKAASSGIEHRDVTVYERINRLRNLAETIRSDTEEVVDTRALTPREAQLSLLEDNQHLN